MKLIRIPRVMELTGLGKSTIARMEKAGTFPRRRHLSARVVAWPEEEVQTWVAARIGVSAGRRPTPVVSPVDPPQVPRRPFWRGLLRAIGLGPATELSAR